MCGGGRQKGRGGAPRFEHHRKQRSGHSERQWATPASAGGTPRREGKLRIGELRLHRDGYGFVTASRAGPATEPSAGREEDLFIPARFIGDAMHTDVVEVRALPGRKGKLEGRIVRIVSRNVTRLMGRIERLGRAFQVISDDRRVRHRIVVPFNKVGKARHNDNVVVRLLSYPLSGSPAVGEVIEVLGPRGEEETERTAVITRHQLAHEFPPTAIREADLAFKMMDEAAIANRRDLRNIPFVTIDGENAKDFDDAVAVERLGSGDIRLWVSIADVSYFVRPGTALDKAAYERGTSVYFPAECLPMLPEQLSANLCSLRPNEDRFTITVAMDVDPQGEVVRKELYRSVIRSKERMTYTVVKRILIDRDHQMIERYRDLVPQFELMAECHRRLRARRMRNGSIDFDLPEPEIVIDMQGEVSSILRAERHVGHMMIEDFMITANEAVAEMLTARGPGCIYRIHEPPTSEKLTEFRVLLHNLGIRFHVAPKTPPGALARVVEAVRGRPEERLVNHMLLRSMAQAVYSTENKGHYGLASKCYCHFTSPIRRYPDLVVHRLLTCSLAGERGTRGRQDVGTSGRRDVTSFVLATPPTAGERTSLVLRDIASPHALHEIAEHCSRRERIAMEAERETAKLYAATFMQDKIGQEFEGVISHTTKFGFFVELVEYFVEGLVLIDTLADDRYRFEDAGMMICGRRKGRVFKIGDLVRVEVVEVDIPEREIHLELVC